MAFRYCDARNDSVNAPYIQVGPYEKDMTEAYKAPDVPSEGVTPAFVRDELLKCFESANREFMSVLNRPTSEPELKAQVRQFVTGSFQSCGESFEDPTKQGIVSAINTCKSNAESMMGPKGAAIIRHHYDEMMKLVTKLPDGKA
jgi:hypothetical protein